MWWGGRWGGVVRQNLRDFTWGRGGGDGSKILVFISTTRNPSRLNSHSTPPLPSFS